MSAETILHAALAGNAPLAAAVSNRIYPDFVPQDKDTPSIAYSRASTEFFDTIHAPAVAHRVTFDVGVIDVSRTAAEASADLAQTALRAANVYVTDRRAEFDAAANRWAVSFTAAVFVSS